MEAVVVFYSLVVHCRNYSDYVRAKEKKNFRNLFSINRLNLSSASLLPGSGDAPLIIWLFHSL